MKPLTGFAILFAVVGLLSAALVDSKQAKIDAQYQQIRTELQHQQQP